MNNLKVKKNFPIMHHLPKFKQTINSLDLYG